MTFVPDSVQQPIMNKFGTVSSTIEIEGPRFTGRSSTLQRIVFDISTNGTVLIKPTAAPIIPVYAGALNYVANVMNISEIICEKIRAICSMGRKHKERDLYDIYILLGKDIKIDINLVKKKFDEVSLTFSPKLLEMNILSINKTWKDLAPFVQHRLEEHDHVCTYVLNMLKKNNILG